MAAGKRVDTAELQSVEDAIRDGDYAETRKRMALRLARMMDNSESARDVKAVAMSLAPLVDRIEQDERERERERDILDSPLMRMRLKLAAEEMREREETAV